MTEHWYCLSCRATGELNQQGRCGTCDSDSVVSQEANYTRDETRQQIEQLERMFKMEKER